MNQELYPRWTLMQSLYYPAVLGTGVVLLINKFTVHKSFVDTATDISIYFGILLVVYFSVSFLISNSVSPRNYGTVAFLSDFTEIVILFFAFYFLGFFDPTNPSKTDFRWFYLVVAGIPVLQQIWNYAVNKDKSLYILSAVAVTILLISSFWGYKHEWYNAIMIFVFTGLIGVYFYYLYFRLIRFELAAGVRGT